MYKILIGMAICIACIAAFAFAGRGKSSNILVVGTNAEFAPFSFREGNKIVGFDIDIAREVCQRLGKEMELKDMPFDALLPELTLGSVHFVAAGMSCTEERAKRVKEFLVLIIFILGIALGICSLGAAQYWACYTKDQSITLMECLRNDVKTRSRK